VTSSSPSGTPVSELLPATSRALTHRIAVGQAEGRTPSLVGAVARDGGQAWCGAGSTYLDAGPAAGATIAQLLSHTAGLPSETPGP
jgi:hypothetical protein